MSWGQSTPRSRSALKKICSAMQQAHCIVLSAEQLLRGMPVKEMLPLQEISATGASGCQPWLLGSPRLQHMLATRNREVYHALIWGKLVEFCSFWSQLYPPNLPLVSSQKGSCSLGHVLICMNCWLLGPILIFRDMVLSIHRVDADTLKRSGMSNYFLNSHQP